MRVTCSQLCCHASHGASFRDVGAFVSFRIGPFVLHTPARARLAFIAFALAAVALLALSNVFW